ncbi:16S rRNA (uracil(1498)-N(3))-methyltransferase [bacterium]|nr:16S rRNA (uracil(1498)-N(3))-methyltransferase [bacterium]
MPHFIIKSQIINNNSITIDDKNLYNHIVKVMRARIGEKLKFIDEKEIQYETVIENISNSSFNCKIEKSYKSVRKLPLNLYVAQSVLNSDAQISALQKATELGVKGIIPLYTDNCSVKESFIKNKIEKWKKVIFESVQQCERADIPQVFDLKRIDEIIKDFDYVIVFAERYANKTFFDYIKENKIDKSSKILVIIGPEGGFSQKEFDYFIKNNLPLITLGKLIYRADTALTAALTVVINGVLYG